MPDSKSRIFKSNFRILIEYKDLDNNIILQTVAVALEVPAPARTASAQTAGVARTVPRNEILLKHTKSDEMSKK